MMRWNQVFLFIILILLMLPYIISQRPVQAVDFTSTTTFYIITGEQCYGEQGFTGSYAISGKLGVRLTPLSPEIVRCETWEYSKEGDSENMVEKNVIVTDRQESDGNYTLFFMDLPTNSTIQVNSLNMNVVARYLGERYLSVGAKSVKTLYYGYVVNELQSVLRFEWYFEAESGILLKFSKAIDLNFVRVQWLDYTVLNTTLSLADTPPVSAFFTNIREDFFAGTGAIIVVIILFYILTQKKVQRSDSL